MRPNSLRRAELAPTGSLTKTAAEGLEAIARQMPSIGRGYPLDETTDRSDAVVYAAASAIGIVAGMRAMTAPAIVSYMASSNCLELHRERFGLFGHPHALKLLIGLASGEALFDKLPFMPKRTETAGLVSRILSGAVCGATICKAKQRSAVVGAIAGAFGAVGATFAVYNVRLSLSRELQIPDAAIALLEDTTAIWAGKVICEGLSKADAVAV